MSIAGYSFLWTLLMSRLSLLKQLIPQKRVKIGYFIAFLILVDTILVAITIEDGEKFEYFSFSAVVPFCEVFQFSVLGGLSEHSSVFQTSNCAKFRNT